MSDETPKATLTPEPTLATPANTPSLVSGLPGQPVRGPITIMRGGTTSSAVDAANAAFMAETRQRWAERDAERAEASVPVEAGGAVEKSLDLGQPHMNLVAVVGYKDRDTYHYMQCDIHEMETEDGTVDLAFVFVCMKCIKRGMPQTMAQNLVRNSNRKWHLDTKFRGEIFHDHTTREVWRLAGRIECDEILKCDKIGCDGRYKIGGKADRPGTSQMVEV